jgi:uncharacterized membrane protein
MKMTATRDIARPAGQVFDFFADASNNPTWQKGMQSCEWTSQPPIAVGSTYQQTARFMGRDILSTFEVTAHEPGRLIAIETIKSTFPIQVVRTVEPTGNESCRVSADITGGPERGVAKLVEPLIGRWAQKSVDRDYDRLVQLLESASSDSTENSPSE